MGVQGLLPLLKSIHKPCSLQTFAGKTLGVDAYGWLHRGTVTCALDLAQGRPTSKFVDFAMSRVRMLVHFGVRPYLVFDGDYLPSKGHTEKDRAARRKESRRVGLDMLAMGRTTQAQAELQKAVDVTPEMARQLIEELKSAKIDYVVAPYEADSQLVYLERRGLIDGILSEDSDMLVFGAKCLLTKLDQYGECIVIRRCDFTACKDISLVGWSDTEFRTMAILSGCDYLPGIEKMGLKTAYRLLRKHKTVERVVRSVQLEGKMKIPPGYLEAHRNAEATFLYQWVYCPTARTLVNLTEPAPDVDVSKMHFIGSKMDCATARKVAQGLVHPHTKQLLKVTVVPRPEIRSWLRKSVSQATPPLKQHQSIESFFKPRRTPLAELDPNHFTPSPTQQRLLEQQGGSWPAQVVGHEDIGVSVVTSVAQPAALPAHPMRRATSDAFPLFASGSTKRQRLCADASLAGALGSQPTSIKLTSRFFATKPDVSSPSIKKTRGNNAAKAARSKIEIWSDDSVEDALLQLDKYTTSFQTSGSQADTPGTSQDTDAASNDSQGIHAVNRLALQSFEYGCNVKAATYVTIAEDDGNDLPSASREDVLDSAEVPCSSPPLPAKTELSLDRFAFSGLGDTRQSDQDATPLATRQSLRPLAVSQELESLPHSLADTVARATEDIVVSDSEFEGGVQC